MVDLALHVFKVRAETLDANGAGTGQADAFDDMLMVDYVSGEARILYGRADGTYSASRAVKVSSAANLCVLDDLKLDSDYNGTLDAAEDVPAIKNCVPIVNFYEDNTALLTSMSDELMRSCAYTPDKEHPYVIPAEKLVALFSFLDKKSSNPDHDYIQDYLDGKTEFGELDYNKDGAEDFLHHFYMEETPEIPDKPSEILYATATAPYISVIGVPAVMMGENPEQDVEGTLYFIDGPGADKVKLIAPEQGGEQKAPTDLEELEKQLIQT